MKELSEFKPNIDEVIERYKAYCRFEDTDRPLLCIRTPLKSLRNHPYWIGEIPRFNVNNWPYIMQLYEECYKERRAVKDDLIPVVWPDMGPASMAAFMGCPVEFVSGTSWSASILHDWSKMDEIRFDPDNKWFRKCLRFLDFLVEHGGNRFAVGPPDISPGSPGDLAAAIRGRKRFIVDLYRHPEEAKELMSVCAKAYIEIVDTLSEKITHPFGGTVIGWLFNWVPGRRSGIVQEDLTVLLSPELYRSLIKPFDEQAINHLEYSVFHNDGAWQITPELLKIVRLGVIQMTDPPGGPRALEVEAIKGENRNKPIMIRCWSLKEIKRAIKTLGHRGLHITTRSNSIKEANKLVGEVEAFVQKL